MQQQWQNGNGETVYVSPGQQLPYGSTWQQVGGVSNPMGGGSRVPSLTYQQPTSSSSSSPFGSSTTSSPFSVSSSSSYPSSTYSGSGSTGSGISLPPFLDRSQRRAAALGFLIGFVLAYLPFILRGLGNYSSYPFIVSSEAGFCFGSVFCAFSLMRKAGSRHPVKALLVLGFCYILMTHFARYVPFVRLYQSLL